MGRRALRFAHPPTHPPSQWLAPLSATFDAMPPRPRRAVAADLERGLRATEAGAALALGRRARATPALLASVDATPLATASIAQVHAAELTSQAAAAWAHGTGVVVKIQNVAARALMDSDVRNLGRLATFVGDIMPFDVGGVSKRGEWGVRGAVSATPHFSFALSGS